MVKVVAAVVALAGLGCLATAPPETGKPIVQFPSPARLAAVEAKSAALPPVTSGEVPPEGWSVEPPAPAPAPDPASSGWAPRGVWEETFAAAYTASGRKAALTRQMACAAGELGRFYLEKHAAPPEPLQRFVTAACGIHVPGVGYQYLTGTIPDRVADERALPPWKDDIGARMVGRLPADAKHAGFWFGRHNGHAVALMAFESAPVELAPFSPVPNFNGDVSVEGRFEGDVAFFDGYVNQGRFGVHDCLVDPSVPRPRFRVSCRMAADDETAWIEIVYAPHGSVLAQPIVQVLARRDVRKPLVYTETPHAPSRPVKDVAAFGPAVIEGLNATRAEAGLTPVRLADAQSAAAARLARQYFAAALGKTGVGDLAPGALDDMNTIALGLLAGWQVTGTIRDGTFFSAVVPRTRDAGRWVDSALAMPLGRHALMASDIDEVALGSALFDDPAIGAVACGYRFVRGNDHTADVNRLRERIATARQRVGLPPPVPLRGMDAVLSRELARVQQGTWTPMTALKASLQEASDRFSASMRGIVVEATSLDALEIPPEVLKQANLQIEVGVTHYKPPGAAWAQLVIIVVYASTHGVSI